MADQHYDVVRPANGSVPPRRGRIAAPLQNIARHHDRAGDEPAGAALIVPANVDEQHGLRGLDSGSAREQETYRVQPNELRALGTGECYVIHHGTAARVSVGLPAGAFGVYPVPAWLDQHRHDQAQLRPPVEPGQVRKPATEQRP